MKTTVVLADDHASFREMLALVLASEGSYEVVAHARTGFEALKVCRKWKPRLVILDLALPEMNGAAVMREIRPEMRDLRWLVYSGTPCSDLTREALETNPHGFVHKRDGLMDFRDALKAVANGKSYLTSFATQFRDEDNRNGGNGHGRAQLTACEGRVLQLIAEGMTNKEMARLLNVASKTVEHHRANLMGKLNLHSVALLTRYAVKIGLVPTDV